MQTGGLRRHGEGLHCSMFLLAWFFSRRADGTENPYCCVRRSRPHARASPSLCPPKRVSPVPVKGFLGERTVSAPWPTIRTPPAGPRRCTGACALQRWALFLCSAVLGSRGRWLAWPRALPATQTVASSANTQKHKVQLCVGLSNQNKPQDTPTSTQVHPDRTSIRPRPSCCVTKEAP